MSSYEELCEALGLTLVANVPVILWGVPGVGKTSVVEQIASHHGWWIETVIASISDPTDFRGMPREDAGSTTFSPPSWATAIAEAGGGLVFLDEITTGPTEFVQFVSGANLVGRPKELSWEQFRDALAWVQAERVAAIKKCPYLDTALSAMIPVPALGLGTLANDRRWRFYYDPHRTLKQTRDGRIDAVISDWIHEVGHQLRDHCARWRELTDDSGGNDGSVPTARRETIREATAAKVSQHVRAQGVRPVPSGLRGWPDAPPVAAPHAKYVVVLIGDLPPEVCDAVPDWMNVINAPTMRVRA